MLQNNINILHQLATSFSDLLENADAIVDDRMDLDKTINQNVAVFYMSYLQIGLCKKGKKSKIEKVRGCRQNVMGQHS